MYAANLKTTHTFTHNRTKVLRIPRASQLVVEGQFARSEFINTRRVPSKTGLRDL